MGNNMTLIDLIKIHALTDAQAGNWSAVATTLNAQTVEVRNAKSWTMADLITLLGPESAAVIGGTIQAAGATNPIFAGAWLALNITGLQLHTDERQAMITSLADAAGWPSELKAAALAVGLTYTSLAGIAVTAEECQSEYESSVLAQQWSTLLNESIHPAASNRADLITALRSAADTLENG